MQFLLSLSFLRLNKFGRVSIHFQMKMISDQSDPLGKNRTNATTCRNFDRFNENSVGRKFLFARQLVSNLKFTFVARANRRYNNRYRDCFSRQGTNTISQYHATRWPTASRGNTRASSRFFRGRNSWKRTCPPFDIKIYLRKSEARNFRSLDRSQIFARVEAIANLVFPRVYAYSATMIGREPRYLSRDRSTDQPIDRTFSISSFSSRSRLPSSSSSRRWNYIWRGR